MQMNTDTESQSTNTVLNWETDAIFEANFMFPTEHFKDAKSIEVLDEKPFCELIETMLTPCQPLSNSERKELAESVHSKNRLRIYYQATVLVQRAIDTVNDLQVNDAEIGSCSEKELVEAFEYRGHQVVDMAGADERKDEDEKEAFQIEQL